MDVPALLEVVKLLALGSGVGVVVSFLFEQIGFFQRLEANVKRWTMFGLTIGLPLAAQIAVQFVPPDVWVLVEPYWQAIALGFLAWTGSQIAHLWHKKMK